MPVLFWVFTIVIPLVVVLELVGVFRKGKQDTITETWRHWRDLLPKPVRVLVVWLLAGFLLWAVLHLAWDLV
jgi:hypothetical protein